MVRQASNSSILKNATQLRDQLNHDIFDKFQFDVEGAKDILYTNSGMDLFEDVENAFAEDGVEQSVFIVRYNKRANQFNEHIRKRIIGWEDELSVGDLLMVVKNNYFWIAPESRPGFIAN